MTGVLPANGPALRYERAVRKVQADARVPALSVALHRADRGLWTCTVGASGNPAHSLDADSRFRIGSVTKTFTAVLVMQARDDGLLDLDDPSGKHLDVPAHGQLAVCGHVEVRRQRVVEVEETVVAGLQHQDGGERLGDRADPEPAGGAER